MAKHKKTKTSEVVKTYSFKVKANGNTEMSKLQKAIDEYQKYYNCCSDWIKNHLFTKIGDLYSYMPEESKSHNYAKDLISDEWRDKPVYMMFKKDFAPTSRDNALFMAIKSENPESYTGNIFNFSSTCYRRFGYVASVISNYVTKISKTSTSIKRKSLSENPTDEELTDQVIYEMGSNGWINKNDWKDQIEYLSMKSDCNPIYFNRMKTLSEYFFSNEKSILEKMDMLTVESLVKFGGCRRNADKRSMYIGSGCGLTIKQLDENSFNFKCANIFNIDVFGRRDVIKDNILLVDIVNKHSESFVIKIKNGKTYIDVSSTVEFNKEISSTEKVVGVDVNIKHMLLSTNIKDNGHIKNYFNIYKELLKDNEFRKSCVDIKMFEDLAKAVTFCPIEFECLYTRILRGMNISSKHSEMEITFSNVLDRLCNNIDIDKRTRIYLENVRKLRCQLKAYVVIKDAYNKKQSEYDLNRTDEERIENPFSNTKMGKEFLSKLDNISNTILGCKKNIIDYAYNVFYTNGYSMIALEKLINSNFEKQKSLPSIQSLLKYHKILGCTMDELKEKSVYNLIADGNYELDFIDGKVSDARFSEIGKAKLMKTDFFNLMIKSLHFADTKDYFITLSNNGKVGVSLVSPCFTSQMDSINHKVYCTKDNNKLNLVRKNRVRKTQEYHINGLNADYNAACNIAYVVENDVWRDMFMKKSSENKSLYNKPSYDTLIKNQATMIKKLKANDAIMVLDCEK